MLSTDDAGKISLVTDKTGTTYWEHANMFVALNQQRDLWKRLETWCV